MATLTGYGLHELVWETADEWVGDVFVASPADAEGRGIALTVKRNGAAADLSGATVYFLWRHRESLARGTTPFEEVDASTGTFQVYYPAAMAGHEGTVDAQVMVSEGGECLSTRTFQIRVEPVLVGDDGTEDGFTLFVGAIQAYENAGEIASDAAMAANEAARAALQAIADLRAAAESGTFDGADGADGIDGLDGVDGEDGVSPTVSVETTSSGHRITVTDESGPHSFDVVDGKDGVSPTAYVEQTSTGARVTVTDGSGTTTATLTHGPKGDKGDQGLRGASGAPGADGVSCTHAWSGSVLTISSASGVSSADLAGPQGPTGARGPQGPVGPAGADGDDYVLTSQDKSDIATLVAAMFTNGDTTGW